MCPSVGPLVISENVHNSWYKHIIHISIYSNIQIYILQYNHDGIQKKGMQLIQICFPLNKMVHSLKLYPVKINKNMICIQTKKLFFFKCIERERERERESKRERESTLNAQTVYYPIFIFEL